MMIIKKIFNNNAVVASDYSHEEVVVMGSGVGFSKSVGESVDESRIEKIYKLKQDGASQRLVELLEDIPTDYLAISTRIIEMAKSRLKTPLSDHIYVSLPDHINNLIQLNEEGVQLKNPLLWEVKKFYPEEFAIGLETITMIHDELGISLIEDEAGNIAFHFINAQMNGEYTESSEMTQQMKKIQDILGIIEYNYGLVLDDKSINYERFVTHLKFFFQRLNQATRVTDDDDNFLYEQIKSKYREAFQCMLKIEKYLGIELVKDEKVYLTIHIERLTKQTNKEI